MKFHFLHKSLFLMVLFVLLSVVSDAQSKEGKLDYRYINKYDLVSYFEGDAVKGVKEYSVVYEKVKFRFISSIHRAAFVKEPTKYLPQYGGYCAYAMEKNGKKYRVNPKSFEIVDGKLYFFYHSFFYNAKRKWNDEKRNFLRDNAESH